MLENYLFYTLNSVSWNMCFLGEVLNFLHLKNPTILDRERYHINDGGAL